MHIRILSKPTASGALKPLMLLTWDCKELCPLLPCIQCSEWPNGCGPIFNLLFHITVFFVGICHSYASYPHTGQWCGILVLAWTICWTIALLPNHPSPIMAYIKPRLYLVCHFFHKKCHVKQDICIITTIGFVIDTIALIYQETGKTSFLPYVNIFNWQRFYLEVYKNNVRIGKIGTM